MCTNNVIEVENFAEVGLEMGNYAYKVLSGKCKNPDGVSIKICYLEHVEGEEVYSEDVFTCDIRQFISIGVMIALANALDILRIGIPENFVEIIFEIIMVESWDYKLTITGIGIPRKESDLNEPE